MADLPQGSVQKQASKSGYCSAVPVTKEAMLPVIAKPNVNTSDYFYTCKLPKRFEYPHWSNCYGQQTNTQHPCYRTSNSDYGWFPPGYPSVPSVFFPANQKFTNHLGACGMYRNFSLNTGMDPSFT